MSLLSMCKAAAIQCSADEPAAIVGSVSGSTGALMLRAAREEAQALKRRFAWEDMTQEYVFTTSASDEQANGLPSDFDRLIPDTMYNRTRNRYIAGPISASEWQRTKSSLVTTVNPLYRIRGGKLLFTPLQPAGEIVAFEYISENFCLSSSGSPQSDWLADTDTARMDESLMTLGIIWRFLQAKGLAYADEQAAYESRVATATMVDGVSPRISTDPEATDRYPTRLQIPETWPNA